MDITDTIDRRLTALEIKASFSEDLLDQLNQVIVQQQQHIDALIHEIARLRRPNQESANISERELRDDLPPHY